MPAARRSRYWLIKPPDFDPAKKYPVVFLLHGGPQGPGTTRGRIDGTRRSGRRRAGGCRAQSARSTGFGQKFVDEISQDWGGKVMEDFDAVFDAVAKMPFVDAAARGLRARATAATRWTG